MTEAGQELLAATQGMSWTEAAPLWQGASADFSSQAFGDVRVFLGPSFSFSSSSIFNTIEFPGLLQNSSVGNIIFHFVGP